MDDSIKQKIWRWEATVAALVFGLGVLAWPICSYGAIFIFDSPIRDSTDELRRYSFAYLTWGYPVLYFTSLFLYIFLRRRGIRRLTSLLAWVFAAATPCYYIWFFTVAA